MCGLCLELGTMRRRCRLPASSLKSARKLTFRQAPGAVLTEQLDSMHHHLRADPLQQLATQTHIIRVKLLKGKLCMANRQT